MIRVLVVDDSAYMRYVLRNHLNADPGIEVIDTARDGLDALEKIAALNPDVVTLDLEMPRMDGFATLKRIMSASPMPVIILSSHTREGADSTIRALRLGAVDFVPKPIQGVLDLQAVCEDLLTKIKHVAGLQVSKLCVSEKKPSGIRSRTGTANLRSDSREVVVIGTSTGGPRALHEVVPHLPQSLPAGVLIVQHMPAAFTKSLAMRLDEISALKVKEAEPGDVVRAGLALVAPGNYHMTVSSGGLIELNQEPPQHGVRPSVDVTMESVAAVYGASAIGVVMTGMGSDGTRGARLIKHAGGKVIAEDESTCVIYGMPRSVIEAGIADRVTPLEKIASEIVGLALGKRSARPAANFLANV